MAGFANIPGFKPVSAVRALALQQQSGQAAPTSIFTEGQAEQFAKQVLTPEQFAERQERRGDYSKVARTIGLAAIGGGLLAGGITAAATARRETQTSLAGQLAAIGIPLEEQYNLGLDVPTGFVRLPSGAIVSRESTLARIARGDMGDVVETERVLVEGEVIPGVSVIQGGGVGDKGGFWDWLGRWSEKALDSPVIASLLLGAGIGVGGIAAGGGAAVGGIATGIGTYAIAEELEDIQEGGLPPIQVETETGGYGILPMSQYQQAMLLM